MTKYLEEGASLSRPSASDRTVNLSHQNKTVNQRWTELIKCAVGLVKSSVLLQTGWIFAPVYLEVNAVLPWPSV